MSAGKGLQVDGCSGYANGMVEGCWLRCNRMRGRVGRVWCRPPLTMKRLGCGSAADLCEGATRYRHVAQGFRETILSY